MSIGKDISAIHVEGGMFDPDFLNHLTEGNLPGQKNTDFGLESGKSLLEEIARTFSEAKGIYNAFRRRLDLRPENGPETSLTRSAWMVPFLALLGYEDLTYNPQAHIVDGLSFHVSHRAGATPEAPPIHIVGARQDLGKRPESGRPRLSPHALLQEYLNRTEHLWGIVTNGRVIRLLRKSAHLRKQAYVEFDLDAIFGNDQFSDFVVLYRLLHRTRLPKGLEDVHQCWLERYFREAQEQGTRARDRIRDGVEEALKILGNGVLRHLPVEVKVSPESLYSQLFRLVYRILFLLVAEERGLLGGNDLYRKYYSISRFRKLVDSPYAYTTHEDLWQSLRVLWYLLRNTAPQDQGRPLADLLGMKPLGGDLFKEIDLEGWRLKNEDLLKALRKLFYYYDEEAKSLRRVNYAYLDVEELGSIYESLLDLQPQILTQNGNRTFTLEQKGSERKSTGSYYTPHELVKELVKNALEPVLESRLKEAEKQLPETATPEEKTRKKEEAILSIKVLDPATGSGHFLLAAARRLGKELARVRTGEEEPPPEAQREAIRDVIAHCIYGVDKNPLAVELCKVALWIEGHVPGKPLTFLDHRIKCGDSLVGVLDINALYDGIPDRAFEPVSGDDKEVAKKFKKTNKRERSTLTIHENVIKPENLKSFAEELKAFEEIQEQTASEVQAKEEIYWELQKRMEPYKTICNFWTAAFFQQYRQENASQIITTATLRTYLKEPRRVSNQMIRFAYDLAGKHRFFHWPAEFPEIFAHGGFDVVLSNPPWERIKLQEKEFFATRDPEIANAANKAARERLIRQLPQHNPALWQEYQEALHYADCLSKFLRHSGRFPLTSRGDINTYSVFAELARRLLAPNGRAGIVVPTGIATDDTNKRFFADLVEYGNLASLFDFENREAIFPAIHRSYKFSLLTIRKAPDGSRPQPSEFAFFCTRAEHLRDDRRRFTLTPEDFALLNPNTRTCPVFRIRPDAELTKAIYRRVPVLVNEAKGENPWSVRFLAMFHMANDSHLFRTREELEAQGFRLVGNRFVKGEEVYLPLYEAKMIWQFDHRYGTYEGVSSRSSTHLPTPTPEQYADPSLVVQPWYWVPAEEVEARLEGWKQGWLLGFRNVTNATNERSAIFSLLPRVGAGNSMPVMNLEGADVIFVPALVANISSLAFDYVVRQKIAGVNMNFFFVKQLPILPPSAYTFADLLFIVPRVLELVFTAWDLKPFADDVWREADQGLKEAIRKQWEENKEQTGGHAWEPPDWLWAYPEIETDPSKGIPLPPFKWDEERRARIRAELDAYYARLYGLTRKQLRYILDPADLTERELEDILDTWEEVRDPLDPEGYRRRSEQSTFPGETFRVLKEKEIRQYGEYRTRRLILKMWEELGNMKYGS